jgi:hypothetical protein
VTNGISKSLLAENKYSATVGGEIPNMPFNGLPILSAQMNRLKKRTCKSHNVHK